MPALALATAPPKVTLRSSPAVPYDGAIAAARTCYSPRVIERSEITDKQRDSIGPLTFDGGHHTVFQHAHFEFGLENISRQLVWSVLHSYPFYNSEQSSQRYVKLNEPRAFVPPITGEALDVYEHAVLNAWDAYAKLSALLKDDAWAILKELRYVRDTNSPARLKTVVDAAKSRGVEVSTHPAAKLEDIVPSIDAAHAAGAKAVNVLAAALLHSNRQVIFERTAALRMPAIYQFPESAEQGGFASYGPRIEQMIYPQLAMLVARLFRGDRPQDIPVQQPTTFELVINLTTARSVGLTIPEGLLVRADKVID